MRGRSVYCYCKNTYTVLDCSCSKKADRSIWRQGIGRINAIPAPPTPITNGVFDGTFDETFN